MVLAGREGVGLKALDDDGQKRGFLLSGSHIKKKKENNNRPFPRLNTHHLHTSPSLICPGHLSGKPGLSKTIFAMLSLPSNTLHILGRQLLRYKA